MYELLSGVYIVTVAQILQDIHIYDKNLYIFDESRKLRKLHKKMISIYSSVYDI